MPDLEISKLPELVASDVQATDPLAIADLSAVETKKVTVATLIEAGVNQLDPGTIDPDKIDWDSQAPNLIDGATIKDRSLPAGKLVADSLTADEIAPNAIGSNELADGAVDTAALLDQAVTADKVEPNSLSDAQITAAGISTVSLADGAVTRVKMTLAANDIDGSVIADNSLTADELAPNSVGASELADDSVDTAALQNNACTADKIATDAVESRHVGNGQIGTSELADLACTNAKLATDSVSTDKVSDDAITADKLAPNLPGSILAASSIDTNQLADNAVTETKLNDAAVTTDKLGTNAVTDAKVSNISGGKIIAGTVPAAAFDAAAFTNGIELDGTVQLSNEIDAGSSAGIEWNSNGMIVGFGPVPAADLPVATSTSIGAISVPASSGFAVSSTGVFDSTNKITPGTTSGFTYDENGNIINAVGLQSSDLPIGTTTDVGAVSVPVTNSNPLIISGTGEITHATSGVTAGTYASTTVDVYGHVTGGDVVLAVNQVPDLPASKVTSGQFGTVRIADASITGDKIADYATCYMQEETPGSDGKFLGQFWYQPSTAQLRVYARGSGNESLWNPVGFGALQQQNLRVGFTYDAENSTIVSITQYGASAGFAAGDPIPAPTDNNSGLYGVCVVPGNNISLLALTGTNHTAGDWILDISAVEGWVHVDVTSGGGGGGGATVLNDLLDVEIGGGGLPPLADKQILRYRADIGQWINTDFTAGALISDTAPALTEGLLWWNSADTSGSGGGRLYVCYDDGDSMQWVPATPDAYGTGIGGGGGGGGGGTEFLNDLKDVNAPSPTANAFLIWDDPSNRWVPATTIDCGTF